MIVRLTSSVTGVGDAGEIVNLAFSDAYKLLQNGRAVVLPGEEAAPVLASSVQSRAPGATDDVSLGYAPGDYWRFGNRLYRCLSAVRRAARWELRPTRLSVPWTAQVGTAPAALFLGGPVKMHAGYTLNRYARVTREDGQTFDIPFSRQVIGGESMDVADIDAALTWAAGSRLWLIRLYNHLNNESDVALRTTDCVQGAADNRPRMIARRTPNGMPVITFEATVAAQSGTQAAQWLDLPPVTMYRQNIAYFTACVLATTSSPASFLNLGATSNLRFQNEASGAPILSTSGRLAVYGTAARISQFQPPAGTPFALGLVTTSAGSVVSVDGTAQHLGAVSGNGAHTGGRLGADNLAASNILRGHLTHAALYNLDPGGAADQRALSDDQVVTARELSMLIVGAVPQARVNLVIDGDSLPNGTGTVGAENMSVALADLLGPEVRIFNLGVGSSRFAVDGGGPPAVASARATAYPLVTRTLLRSNQVNVLLSWFNGNDIVAGASVAQTLADAATYVGIASSDPWTARIFSTPLPRDGVPDATAVAGIAAFAASVRAAGASFGDYIWDVNLDPIVAASGASAAAAVTPTELYVDVNHLTSYGHTIAAQGAASLVARAVRERGFVALNYDSTGDALV